MTFDPKREVGHYITVDVPATFKVNPTLKNPRRETLRSAGDETAQEEPIGVLRARLISEWLEFLQSEGAKRGNVTNVEYLRENDSFCRFVTTTSEGALKKWVTERDEHEKNARVRRMRQSWETAVKAVLALRGGKAEYQGKISMDELESSAAFQNLSEIDKKSARWVVENHQDAEFAAKS